MIIIVDCHTQGPLDLEDDLCPGRWNIISNIIVHLRLQLFF